MKGIEEWLEQQIDDDKRISWDAWASQELEDGLPHASESAPVVAHIDRFADLPRIFSEIDAKRLIIRDHHACPAPGETPSASDDPEDWRGWVCGACGTQYPCRTLRLLAVPYSSRPGYRKEWRS